MPVRLITGSTSPLPARKVVDIIAGECRQAEVVRLDSVGHMGPITHPSLVAAHLAFQPRESQSGAGRLRIGACAMDPRRCIESVLTRIFESHCVIRSNS